LRCQWSRRLKNGWGWTFKSLDRFLLIAEFSERLENGFSQSNAPFSYSLLKVHHMQASLSTDFFVARMASLAGVVHVALIAM
jgi:hypothetical protein